MLNTARWRSMEPDDIAGAYALSRAVHADYPEREAVLAEKRALFPAGCFALEADARVTGYAFSHPWTDGVPPSLDTMLGALPAAPSCYFIHDVTLDPAMRGAGYAAAIVPRLLDAARACRLQSVRLVAVNGAEVFWARFGFAAIADMSLAAIVRAKYGPRAVMMESVL